jgi:hypothetical protein
MFSTGKVSKRVRPLRGHARTGTWGARLGVGVALGTLLGATVLVGPAGASSIGKFTLTGEVVASFKTSSEFNNQESVGGSLVTEPIHGCQVGQQGTNEDVINIPDGKVVVDGKSVKALAISFQIPTDGKTDTITATSDQMEFGLDVGKLTYAWLAASGTITTKANGQSGSFNVTLEPLKVNGSYGANSERSSVQAKGSWSKCTPWP